jgi:hypothetical protein
VTLCGVTRACGADIGGSGAAIALAASIVAPAANPKVSFSKFRRSMKSPHVLVVMPEEFRCIRMNAR